MPDIASPLKPFFPTLVCAEEICFEAIRKKFELPKLSTQNRKALWKIDKSLLRAEWKALITNPCNYPIGIDMGDVPELHWQPSGFFQPIQAEKVFLDVFYVLSK